MRLGVESCLVTFNATSKFLNILRHTLKNTVVSRNDIGDLMKEYAEKNRLFHNQEECSYQPST